MTQISIADFINEPIVETIAKEHLEIKAKKRKASFNLFTISSYTAQLENFHSDILAALLNPKGLHGNGDNFLKLFLAYLNTHYNTSFKEEEFANAIVTRETGRLDIWIRGIEPKQSIIIENKINNAPDMDDQLDRYFVYAEYKEKYPVKSVIYLSLDGNKKAPPTVENLGDRLLNIGAFTSKRCDLLNGWLIPCFEKASDDDSKSFLQQYIKLIQHLSNKKMDSDNLKKFYELYSTGEKFTTVNTIVDLHAQMRTYRADQFMEVLQDISPFKKSFRYHTYYWMLENYKDAKGRVFKLDVNFLDNGNCSIVLWNPSIKGEIGRAQLTSKLTEINMLAEFDGNKVYFNDNGYAKYFRLGEQYKSLADVDAALVGFVRLLLNALKLSK